MDDERFSVFQVVQDDSCQSIRQNVNVDQAVEAFAQGVNEFKHLIVTDGMVSVEWNFGKGIRKL